MKHAICIQCHSKPEIVNKLIEIMPKEYFDFFIHVDKKSDIYDKICKKSNVFFSERIDVRWGQFSQIEATLELFKIIDGQKYQYIHLISGCDFLIKSPKYIVDFFVDKNFQYLDCSLIPRKAWGRYGGEERYAISYPKWMVKRPGKKFIRACRLFYREFVMRTKIFKKRQIPYDKMYGGSSWFSLTGECIEWIKDYLRKDKEYYKFFINGICCDEIFFSTLLMNSPFRANIVNNNLRYIKWLGSKTGGPESIDLSFINEIRESDAIFARKFDDLDIALTIYEKIK